MNIELTIALLAGAVTAAGWLVNHVLSERAERRRQHLQAQLEFTTRQLEQFYGPLAFLMIEGRRVFDDLLDSLGRRYVFLEDEPLPADELETWMFWLDQSFLPRNREIRHLLPLHLLKERHAQLVGQL